MHFSIPDTEVLQDSSGTSFVGFHIHVNGVHHCTLRYKQIRHLHSLLKQEFGSAALCPFPPRQLLKLSVKQIEERRIQLENYLQKITRNPVIVSSTTFCTFLVSAQKETHNDNLEKVQLPIYLMDRQKTLVDVQSMEQSRTVLLKACEQLGIPAEVFGDLSLFILRREDNGSFSLVKQLQDFESPYLALRSVFGAVLLVIRKYTWDLSADARFLLNASALDLLYAQTVADFENGWLHATEDQDIKLRLYQGRGDRLKFLEFARNLKHYNYVQFMPCICDFPEPDSMAIVSAGNKELCFQICGATGDIVQEWCFKVTRIRCWRITTLGDALNGTNSSNTAQLELSFEYLMSKNKHRWITVRSSQVVLMSLTLQKMVEELVKKANGDNSEQANDTSDHSTPSRITFKRDESRDRISFGNSVYDDIGDDDL
ncbi:sorting nexin-17-like isoform X2 [Artemia franciscana]|uniref:sorting nexin-17-like isoform X2 n=1 Tax=Artemia franciscana TaxID=6661 RepID=UPI0032DA9B7F